MRLWGLWLNESCADVLLEFKSTLLGGSGSFFTYGNTSRHNIFARDAPGVVDAAGMARIIRYNDFKHDPLSREVRPSVPINTKSRCSEDTEETESEPYCLHCRRAVLTPLCADKFHCRSLGPRAGKQGIWEPASRLQYAHPRLWVPPDSNPPACAEKRRLSRP